MIFFVKSKFFKIPYTILFVFFINSNQKISVHGKASTCYQATIVGTSWTDRRPDYAVNMTFQKDGSIGSTSIVRREIKSPVAAINIKRMTGEGEVCTLYNIKARLCDFQTLLKSIPMFKSAVQTSLKQSNYSFSCPMKPGVYVMEDIHINSKNPILSFIYQPKSSFVFNGGMFEELPNKSLRPLSTYNITAKIVKKKVCTT